MNLYKYQFKLLLESIYDTIRYPGRIMKNLYKLKIVIRDLIRSIINPYAMIEDDKWYCVEIEPDDSGFDHWIIIPSGYRKNPIMMVMHYSLFYEYRIFDDYLAISIDDKIKIDRNKFKYKITDEEFEKFEKFIEINRDILLIMAHDKSRGMSSNILTDYLERAD